jgi:hypothetical protein
MPQYGIPGTDTNHRLLLSGRFRGVGGVLVEKGFELCEFSDPSIFSIHRQILPFFAD